MADDKLNELYTKQHSIDAQIRARKKEIAKENGQVVDSIDDLACDKHPDAGFGIVGIIPGSEYWKDIPFLRKEYKDGLNIYQCELCGEDKNAVKFDKSKAYDCPTCGIVVGEFERRHYRSSEESWMALAGREGEHYHCRICDTQLGMYYWVMS